MTEDEAVKLSKLNKDAPILDKAKFAVDQNVQKESIINPVHTKSKPLNLPKPVVSHLKRHLKEENKTKTRLNHSSATSPKARVSNN